MSNETKSESPPEASSEKEKTPWHKNPFTWGIVLSAVYLIIAVLIIGVTQHCYLTELPHRGHYPNVWWWDRLFGCRSINELGDFFAGAFAPLAFLWLVVAVFIQSRELKEQREELKLTNKEYALMRGEVTQTNKHIERQTEFMADERSQQAETAEDALMDVKIKQFDHYIRKTFYVIFSWETFNQQQVRSEDSGQHTFELSQGDNLTINSIEDWITQMKRMRALSDNARLIKIKITDSEDLLSANFTSQDLHQQIVDQLKSVSKAKRQQLNYYPANHNAAVIEANIKYLESFNDED